MIARPRAAIADYSADRAEKRWENDRHREAFEAYRESQSAAFVEDSQAYYRTLDRPIDRTKWEFLKRRKAWFHPPVGWNRFASPGAARVLDLGCGDGDQTQRVAEFVAGTWARAGFDGFPMEVVGIDLNDSRVANARPLAESPREKITLRFQRADATTGLPYEDDFFDYPTMLGLLEVLDEEHVGPVLDEVARLTASGIYVRDILDDHPGLSPRADLAERLSARGFEPGERHRVFEEPFTDSGTEDPLGVWPMHVHQVLFAPARDAVPPDERY